jgi:hypothetical protein
MKESAMIVVSEIDGLTQGERVFRRGMAFVLDESLAKEIRGLTDSQLEAKQKRVYGKRIYRRAGADELIAAFKSKFIKMDDMEKDEKKAIIEYIRSDGEQKLQTSQALMDLGDFDGPVSGKKSKEVKPIGEPSEG